MLRLQACAHTELRHQATGGLIKLIVDGATICAG